MTGWRRDVSSLGLVVAALLTAAGYGLAFTQVGANLVFASWGLAFASAALYPSLRRFLAAAIISLFFFWYVGAVLAVGFALYEGVRAARRMLA